MVLSLRLFFLDLSLWILPLAYPMSSFPSSAPINSPTVSTFAMASVEDVQSLAIKLTQFSQTLNPVELALLMELVKRCMPSIDVQSSEALAATPAVFGAWINSIVPGESRWYNGSACS